MDNIVNKRNHSPRCSITPSGYFGNSSDMIQERENFLTEEEIIFLSDFAKNNNVWDVTETHYNENGTIIYDHNVWVDRVLSYHNLLKTSPEVVKVLEDIIIRLKEEIQEFYNVECEPSKPAIVRWPVGTMQMPHADKELHEGPDAGKPNDFPWYDLGTVFYLNDEYEGGELYFPLQGIGFKPKRGAVYFLPGDKNFIHGVTPVRSGCRYTAPFFWHIKKLGENNND
jgi:hypothetical protein